MTLGNIKVVSHCRVHAQLQFRTKATTTSFLVGYDTHASRPFISQLRNPVNTVEEAHKELLPQGVKLKPDCKRQGEWFFNPVSQRLNKQLMHKVGTCHIGPIDAKTARWPYSTHKGVTLQHDKKIYALGTIKDNRKGRHEPLCLDTWHEVIRNNEVEVAAKSATWD
jgi:hypothetical protein